jgi:hypothetical protein
VLDIVKVTAHELNQTPIRQIEFQNKTATVSEAAHCFSITLVFKMLPMSRDLFGLPQPDAKLNGLPESIGYQYIAIQECSYTYRCTVQQTERPQHMSLKKSGKITCQSRHIAGIPKLYEQFGQQHLRITVF